MDFEIFVDILKYVYIFAKAYNDFQFIFPPN